MTTISAKIIADSIGEHAPRLTTMELRYPRIIHSEFMTHRQFSRNASSSRAIPVERLIQDVIDDPFVPIHWGANKKGMQEGAEHSAKVGFEFTNLRLPVEAGLDREFAWAEACNNAVSAAKAFADAGYAKSICNRLIEPFSHINVVVTATNYSNFFALRDHPDAEPHIRLLAQAMKRAMAASTPEFLQKGGWHAPYIASEDRVMAYNTAEAQWIEQTGESANSFPLSHKGDEADLGLTKVSSARCARVSYKTHDGKTPDFGADLALFERLSSSGHWSPMEHQAQVSMFSNRFDGAIQSGNFAPGWIQYRKTFANECASQGESI